MSQTIPAGTSSMERKGLDHVRPRMAQAALTVNVGQSVLTAVVKDALLRHYGSLKAAAITMGEMDQGQLTRELDNGKLNLARLDLLDDAGKAEIAKRLHDTFSPAAEDAKTRARRVIPQLIRELLEAVA